MLSCIKEWYEKKGNFEPLEDLQQYIKQKDRFYVMDEIITTIDYFMDRAPKHYGKQKQRQKDKFKKVNKND